jgi:hypothetical protein
VRGQRRPQVGGGAPAVQGEEHRHAVDGVDEVAEAAVQRVAGQLRVDVDVVAGEGERGPPDAAGRERREQAAGERPLPGPVESLDDDQPSHGRRSCHRAPRPDGRVAAGPAAT